MDTIDIIGARAHNLKDISLSIPRNALVVVTGVSGSGKSSLAFDTIYAEGQRRYVDTLNTYARQFMGMLERPDVDDIRGLSPILAIEQKTTGRNPRSTIGTVTEIYDFFRLLFARASQAYSPATGKEMVRYSDAMIVDLILSGYAGRKILLLAPLVTGRKGHYKDLFEHLVKKGYTQVMVDDQLCDLSTIEPLDRYKSHFIYLVVDKLQPDEGSRSRVFSSVQTALGQGKGSIAIMEYGGGPLRFMSKNYVCPDTGMSFPVPAPHTFSFNSPQGACPHCGGLGKIVSMDYAKLIPNPHLSLASGGIAPLGVYRKSSVFEVVEAIAKKYGFSLNTPVEDIPQEAMSVLLYGSEELFRIGSGANQQMVSFEGIIPRTMASGSESDESLARKERFMEETVCPVCGGTRLKKESLCFKIAGLDIAQVAAMDIDTLYDWVRGLPEHLSERQNLIAEALLKEICDRVGFLKEVGLGYLSLDRPTATLSGGESQRIRLATQIGSKLVNVLYILDEPSIGLHQRDNDKLIDSLKKLRDEGNSVMVVEHDREIMEQADWLVDIGPGAGEQGGELLYNGSPAGIGKAGLYTPTLDYLLGRRCIDVPGHRRAGNGSFLVLRGARGNNLKDVTLSLPLGCLIGVSGVSGSGKSSLVSETLMPILSNKLYRSLYPVLPYDTLEGIGNIDKVIEVDQQPIGRSPRSNPATYINVFTAIRELFGATPDAKIRGFKAGRFSFNTVGGRCESCKGAGVQEIEMRFLPPAHVTCKECGGKRYKPDTLAVRYKGKNINDVLEMTVSQACEFFHSHPFIYPKLKAMEDVGLGYVKLGQPSTTLSGGESQRVKLAAELSRKSTGNTLYLLDEPTTGLHFDDIKRLMEVLGKIVDQGNTVVIIEHNLDVLKCVDYLVDMGPEGGAAGGHIVCAGTPEDVAACPESYTGRYLAKVLGQK
ncbi:MAG: excinuclease ABC subunit UvrA [Bacteroidales bacterium]|nr:excinuclease ABC subunit UvrA [Bacteroidales bacterium]